jgi:hypothetical protein
MTIPAKWNGWVISTLAVALFSVPNPVSGTDWKQVASVTFVEMPWGRFTQISIEYLPDLGDSIEEISEYMDPAKRDELMAEVQAEALATDPDAVGRHILITVPGLEYGMTGQWSNVRIESGKGISVPADEPHIGSATSVGQQTHYTGELIITELSEDVLRGSYRAQLFNSEASRREYEAGRRDYMGELAAVLDFDLSPLDAPVVNLPGVPEELSESDAELLKRIQEAGVDPDVQGQMLEMLRGMDSAMQDMVLKSQSDSY